MASILKSVTSMMLIAFVAFAGLAMALDPNNIEKTPEKVVLKHENYLLTSPVELVKNPDRFMNKGIEFEATFNSFSNIGLDYKKAFRDSKDYISMLILRPDVEHHKIPMSELKLIYPREKSEAVLHLESGDKVRIKGSVFSSALHDPWVDVEVIEVLKKEEKKDAEDEDSETCC